MAGRGPAPKPPGERRRRNKPPESTVLPAAGRKASFPPLPAGYRSPFGGDDEPGFIEYLPETRAWYDELCRSPEGSRFSGIDLLYLRDVVAPIYDKYVGHPTKELASELRLQLAQFGSTPDAKKRQGWTIEDTASESKRPAQRRHLRAIDAAGK